MFKVAKKLKNGKLNIRKWNKSNFGNIFHSKAQILEELRIIQDVVEKEGYNDERMKVEKSILYELQNIIIQEKTYRK